MTTDSANAYEAFFDDESRVVLTAINDAGLHVRHLAAVSKENGLETHTFDDEQFQPLPRRARGTRTVADLDSLLIELQRRPLTATGTLWGSATAGKLTAI